MPPQGQAIKLLEDFKELLQEMHPGNSKGFELDGGINITTSEEDYTLHATIQHGKKKIQMRVLASEKNKDEVGFEMQMFDISYPAFHLGVFLNLREELCHLLPICISTSEIIISDRAIILRNSITCLNALQSPQEALKALFLKNCKTVAKIWEKYDSIMTKEHKAKSIYVFTRYSDRQNQQ